MTAQDDQNFYEKKERLLRRVQAGTATQAQKDWLVHWGFQEKSEPQPLKLTYDSPTKTGPVYRYRDPMKATPVVKLEGPGGPGTRRNRYGKLIAPKKGQRGKRRSVFVKYQSMR
jgi:hypothetical protein